LTALAKLPADRFATAAEFATAMSTAGPATRRTSVRGSSSSMSAPAARRALLFGALALATTLAVWGWARGRPSETPAVLRFTLEPQAGSDVAFPVSGIGTYLAVSPDGRYVVYAASHGAQRWSLDLRRLDELSARTLPGTEGATTPEFSPDGQWIAFGASDGSLKKITVDGTDLTTLCRLDPAGINSLTWAPGRDLVFSRANLGKRGLWGVSADGGEPARLGAFDTASGERLQYAPRAAEGGRLVFYSSSQASNLDFKIAVMTAKDGRPKVFSGLPGVRALGLFDGHLVYVRHDGALMAAPFDVRALEAGPPLQVMDSIPASPWLTTAALSASGTLFYQRGGLLSRLVLVDEGGRERPLLDSARSYLHPRLSPDGTRLAVEVQSGAGNELWIANLTSGSFERLTRQGFSDRPEWTPDGNQGSTARAAPA
ncbi:MAG TPA: hypothetical protein VIR33_02925, partial [Thermopolyspora sp.]